jgi:hypothetical protein
MAGTLILAVWEYFSLPCVRQTFHNPVPNDGTTNQWKAVVLQRRGCADRYGVQPYLTSDFDSLQLSMVPCLRLGCNEGWNTPAYKAVM